VDQAPTASYARRPASNASTPVIGGAKAWVVRFVVCFLRIGFSPQARHGLLPSRLALASEGHRAAKGHFGCARIQRLVKLRGRAETTRPPSLPRSSCAKTVPKPICSRCRELLFEREQLPQVIDNKHLRLELIEHLEPVIVLRNHRVALARGPQSCLVVFLPNPILH